MTIRIANTNELIFGESSKFVRQRLLAYAFHRFKDYEYFQIDASDFDVDAHIEFGTDRVKEKWAIIFAGWGSTKTRIAEREKTRDG